MSKLWEIPEFENRKVRRKCWGEGMFVRLEAPGWVTQDDDRYDPPINVVLNDTDWEVFRESREITMYRYTYKYDDREGMFQTEWTTRSHGNNSSIFKIETKIVREDSND